MVNMYVCMYACAHAGVRLMLRGVQYPNNSIVNITDVGEGDHFALLCLTDKRPCCGMPPNRFGDWYYPNGSIVPQSGDRSSFYRNRGDDGQVRLHRRSNAMTTTGIYSCEVPDASDVIRTFYVGLLNIGSNGRFS